MADLTRRQCPLVFHGRYGHGLTMAVDLESGRAAKPGDSENDRPQFSPHLVCCSLLVPAQSLFCLSCAKRTQTHKNDKKVELGPTWLAWLRLPRSFTSSTALNKQCAQPRPFISSANCGTRIATRRRRNLVGSVARSWEGFFLTVLTRRNNFTFAST